MNTPLHRIAVGGQGVARAQAIARVQFRTDRLQSLPHIHVHRTQAVNRSKDQMRNIIKRKATSKATEARCGIQILTTQEIDVVSGGEKSVATSFRIGNDEWFIGATAGQHSVMHTHYGN